MTDTAHRLPRRMARSRARRSSPRRRRSRAPRDELARERRELPWVKVDKAYAFEGPEGRLTLADLFGGKRPAHRLALHVRSGLERGLPELLVLGRQLSTASTCIWRTATPSFVAVSRAPLAKLEAYKKRMGWTFRWVSSLGSDFNFDYGVSFKPDEQGDTTTITARIKLDGEEKPGLSAFRRGDDGAIYHTYSTYARGLDVLNGAYQLLDITSKGRDEAVLPWSMAWVKRHDRY